MKWDKYTIDTTTEAEDFISMMLSENGIEGIEIEDNVPLTKEETGEMFFMGVGNEKSLRKRYKDLIKIYHPDNLNGDTGTIQEINREYQVLMQKLEVKYQ